MTSPPIPQPRAKAIPPARDRLQSRLLVWTGIPILCYLSYRAVYYANAAGHDGHVYLSMALAISVFFGLIVWRLKAATPAAATCGSLICFAVTILSGRPEGPSPLHSGLSPLILLFLLTFQATRFGREKKVANGLAEDNRGRNAAQVIANLGVAAWSSSYLSSIFSRPHHGFQWPYPVAAFQGPMLAALAEAAADTVSSEIGQAFGGTPFLLTTLRRVLPGTDGAISLNGTLAGATAAALITATGVPALGLELDECVVVFVAAIAGLFFDSLLGATIERKGWIGNDMVNLASTLFAATVALWLQGILGQMAFA